MTNPQESMPTYQQTIGYALAHSEVQHACAMLEVMHEKGTLDILERDEDGLNVIDRFMERTRLGPDILDVLERLGMEAAYTLPHGGRYIVMDRQMAWLKNNSAGDDKDSRHDSHALHKISSDKIMARMISRVDEGWFDASGCDRGALIVARLVSCPAGAPAALAACWARGIDPNARMKDGSLAVANLKDHEAFDRWVEAGGDVMARVSPTMDYPIWQRWADRYNNASRDIQKIDKIKGSLVGLVDEAQLSDACQFLLAKNQRGNQSEMIKSLNGIPDWMHKKRYTGCPIWLAATRYRPDLVEKLIERKRMRPDFTQRDEKGRSVFYAILKAQDGNLWEKTKTEVSLEDLAIDVHGRGLLLQVLDTYGGLAGLGHPDVKALLWDGVCSRMKSEGTDNARLFLSGIENTPEDCLDGSNSATLMGVVRKILPLPMVCSKLPTRVLVKMVDEFLLVSQDTLSSGRYNAPTMDAIEQSILELMARGDELPVEEWIKLAQGMAKSYHNPSKDFAISMEKKMTAWLARSLMEKDTVQPGTQAASAPRQARF